MHSISINMGINNIPGAMEVEKILGLGTVVVGVFSVIFLFYTNSFLMKRRKKEIGLYNILGMGKNHIAKMLFFETVFISTSCIIVGLICGVLFSRLIFLLLLKALSFKIPFVFVISMASVKITAILFLGIFCITMLTNLMHIRLAKPIELLKGGQVGEKEPKTKWLMVILGILSLGTGYGIALLVESPLLAITLFFVAALLVIFGTYSLFTAGSIVLLKKLRKNKKFYYQINHFTSVSSMIYRMKQNAVGLASICILSSAVLVMLSTTVSLYIGMDDALNSRFPQDVMVQYNNAKQENIEKIDQIINDQKNRTTVTMSDEISYHYLSLISRQEDTSFTTVEGSPYTDAGFNLLTVLTIDEYNKMENKDIELSSNEVLIYSNSDAYSYDEIYINQIPFRVKDEIHNIKIEEKSPVVILKGYYLIVKDIDTIRTIYEGAFNKEFQNLDYFVGFNVEGEDADLSTFINVLNQELKNEVDTSIYVDCKQLRRESFFTLYGGLLFLGIFLGTLFLMATTLIIYYKQISEGYDDQERYAIMQKVGMSHQEVKKTIQSQIIMVFFLPLLAAVIHIAVAFKMIIRLLAVLNLVNIPLFFGCTVVTILIFAIIYAVVYSLTARAYYKIVKA